MADEEVKQETPVEEVTQEAPATEEPKQEELPLAEDAPKQEVKTEEQPKEPEKPKEDWRDKELRRKYAQLKAAQEELAAERAARETAEALAKHAEKPRDDQGRFVAQDQNLVPKSEIQAEAQKLLAKQRYDEDCNKTAQVGQERYKEQWREALGNLETLGGFDPDTMTGLLATDDPAKVLFELGKNPEHYHRIMELPVPRRIVEMGKIAMSQQTTKPVSQAPAPVTPGTGGRVGRPPEVLSDNLEDDQWYAIRDKMRLQYRKSKGLIR